MGKQVAGVVWASARGLTRGPSSIGFGPHLAFKLCKLAGGAFLEDSVPLCSLVYCHGYFCGAWRLTTLAVVFGILANGTWRASVFY